MRKRKVQIKYAPPTDEKVMKQLKDWVVRHRPHTPFSVIAVELGIPLVRFKKAMQGKDLLSGFKWEILETLAATEQAIAVEGSAKSTLTTEKRSETKQLSGVEMDRIHKLQLQVIEKISDPVFCALVGQEISPHRCLMIQGQPECFGCAAPSRLCERCHIQPLAFSEIELCFRCLEQALASEENIHIPEFPKEARVKCPLVNDKAIGVNTCRSMQGIECGTCDAPTRICQECRAKPVHYPDYGTCLSCTVKLFGGNWFERRQEQDIDELTPAEDTTSSRKEKKLEENWVRKKKSSLCFSNSLKELRLQSGFNQAELAFLLDLTRKTQGSCSSIWEYERGNMEPLLSNALRLATIYGQPIDIIYGKLKETINREIEEKKAYLKKHRIKHHFDNEKHQIYIKELSGRIPLDLLLRAIDSVAKFQRCGYQFLSEKLGIYTYRAKALQIRLIEEGIISQLIGRYRGRGQWRHIYVNAENVEEVKEKIKCSATNHNRKMHR